MLVHCPCGKKLNVKDSLLGKKVRCPACEGVFIAGEDDRAEERERGGTGTNQKKRRPDDEAITANQGPFAGGNKTKPLGKNQVKDDGSDEDDSEPRRSSDNKRKRPTTAKKGVPLWRLVTSAVVLVILFAVLGVIVWRAYAKPGNLRLEIDMQGADVFIDGKKQDYANAAFVNDVTIELRPGRHEITVSKKGFITVTKQVTVKSDETEVVPIVLVYEGMGSGAGPKVDPNAARPRLGDFQGTWVLEYSNKVLRTYTVTNTGNILWEQSQTPYLLSLRGKDTVMEAGPVLERWRLEGGKLRIEHFNPKERYPGQGPSETAVGEKKTAAEIAEDAKALRAFAGKWKISYANQTNAEWSADANGKLADGRKLVRIKGQVLFDQLGGPLERLTLDGDKLKVEHYSPSTKFVEDPGNPQVLGTGVREGQ